MEAVITVTGYEGTTRFSRKTTIGFTWRSMMCLRDETNVLFYLLGIFEN